jgi:hypothetical protein
MRRGLHNLGMPDVPARSAYFLEVRAVLNHEDPIGLIAIGAPDDEYDPEVRRIVDWPGPVPPEHVANVFLSQFGEGSEVPAQMAARSGGRKPRHGAAHAPLIKNPLVPLRISWPAP